MSVRNATQNTIKAVAGAGARLLTSLCQIRSETRWWQRLPGLEEPVLGDSSGSQAAEGQPVRAGSAALNRSQEGKSDPVMDAIPETRTMNRVSITAHVVSGSARAGGLWGGACSPHI